MKRFITRIPTKGLIGCGLLAGLLIVSVSWSGQRQYKLGGAWTGSKLDKNDKFKWNCIQTPTDPAGKEGTVHLNALEWSQGYEQGVAALGGNMVSDPMGEVRMISNDTAKWTLMAYQQTSFPVTITAIEVYSGTWKFTGPDTAVLQYTYKVYLPAADADGDGFPDPGAVPLQTVTGLVDEAKRIPIE